MLAPSIATYRGPQDLPAITRAVSSSWKSLGASSQVHLGNLAWRLSALDLTRPCGNLGLWLDSDAQVIAFTALYDAFPLDLFISPQAAHRTELFEEMIDWVEAHWACGTSEKDAQRCLRIGCLATHENRIGMLKARGYRLGEKTYIRMTRPLERLLGPHRLPKGMSIRALRFPEDVDLVVQLHNDVFESLQMDSQRIERVMQTPWYTKEYSCLVETQDRQGVAFAIGCLDTACQAIEFEPVGCLQAWRRRGLTSSLLLDIMTRAAKAGANRASLTAPGTNHGTVEFYRATGFSNHVQEVEYVKSVNDSKRASD